MGSALVLSRPIGIRPIPRDEYRRAIPQPNDEIFSELLQHRDLEPE